MNFGYYTELLFSIPRTAKHKRPSQLSVVFYDEFVNVVQCHSIKCQKQNHRYCVSRAKLFTSGDIELNPGPVVTQGNNPDHLIELLQFRLAQHGLRILGALTKPGPDRIGLTKPGPDRTGLSKPGSDCVRLTKPGPDPKKNRIAINFRQNSHETSHDQVLT